MRIAFEQIILITKSIDLEIQTCKVTRIRVLEPYRCLQKLSARHCVPLHTITIKEIIRQPIIRLWIVLLRTFNRVFEFDFVLFTPV